MRKRVSGNIRNGRFLIVPWVGILLYFNIHAFLAPGKKPDLTFISVIVSVTLVFLLVGCFLYRFFDKAKTIEFDDHSFYVSDKSGNKKVSLDKVTSLAMSAIYINNRHGRRLTYKENDNTEQTVTFFPRIGNLYLPEFENAIKENSESAKVQRSSFGPFQIDKFTN